MQVGDLGRSSVGGKGVTIDVRRGLRFQSPEAICSGTTSKVSPCTILHHDLLTKTQAAQPTGPSPQLPITSLHHSIHTTFLSPQFLSPQSPTKTSSPQHPYHKPLTATPHRQHWAPHCQAISTPIDITACISGHSLQCEGHCCQLLSNTIVAKHNID